MAKTRTCTYVFDWFDEEDSPCTEPPWSRSKEHCVFHDPAKTTEQARREFEDCIKEQFAKGDFDCRGYEFPACPNMFIREREEGVFDFCRLLPDGKTVPAAADFRSAHFPLDTIFSGCRFGDGVNFAMVGFAQGANFADAKFGDNVSFSVASFGGWGNFQVSEFGAAADFSVAQFEKGVSFYWVSFGPEPCFEFADMKEAELKGTRLPYGRFGNCELSGATVDSRTQFNAGRYILGDELAVRRGDWRKEAKKTAYADAEDAYRRIRNLLKLHGFYHDAGEFYYRERVCRRRSYELTLVPWLLMPAWCGLANLLERASGRVRNLMRDSGVVPCRRIAVGIHRFVRLSRSWREKRASGPDEHTRSVFRSLGELLLFDWSCGYGEKPVRLIGWAVGFVLGFALLYWGILAEYIVKDGQSIESFGSALYFSVATFTTLGFGDYAPTGTDWVKLLVSSEAVLGALTIGLAMVTFARKAIRD